MKNRKKYNYFKMNNHEENIATKIKSSKYSLQTTPQKK